MSESMREAVEGCERERVTFMRLNEPVDAGEWINDMPMATLPVHVGPRFTRADVLDLAMAALDARQLAIASPTLAEEALARAARYDDLARRLGDIASEPAEFLAQRVIVSESVPPDEIHFYDNGQLTGRITNLSG